jgi:indolepyruvate ferredoxin oxidoreductase, alpha subunit
LKSKFVKIAVLSYIYNVIGEKMETKYLLGNAAIAYGLAEGKVDGVFAYPGTPSSEIVEQLIRFAGNCNFYIEWSVNEKVAYENAYGASLTGKKTAVVMKHVGLNVASDALMTSAYTGIRGGMVVVVADDPFAHSSQNEQDSRRYVYASKLPCFEPSSIQEANNMASFAFSFSETTGLPVILRSVTRISHGKSEVTVKTLSKRKKTKGFFEKNPGKLVMVPVNARKQLEILNEKYIQIQKDMENLPFNFIKKGEGKTGVICSGASFQYVNEYLEETKSGMPVFKIGTYPLPEKKLSSFLKGLNKVIIFEEGDSVVEENVHIIAQKSGNKCKIYGQTNGYTPQCGELSVEKVERSLNRLKGKPEKKTYSIPELPARAPVLCAGCPHLGSFYILKKVFGKKAIYPGDIGCYTLGIQLGMVDTCLCMGASIGVGTGISRFEKNRDVVSVIGDSTFFHGGIPGLINACYNRANQIIVILDNRTTAMTGQQPHPGTGFTATGEEGPDIEIEKLVRSLGVDKVVTIDPYHIEESITALKEIKKARGVRVIISRRECIFIKKGEEKFAVDMDKCRGCKICLDLSCPAITFENGKAEINSVMCNNCGMCEEICPFDAVIKS